jgi:dTDP-4-dehydrorhamnose reductase
MKIIITGCAGMLGSELYPVLLEKGHALYASDIRFIGETIEYLDVRDNEQVSAYCRKLNPEIIIHLAAETNLELCEKDTKLAYLTNTIGTRNVAWICRELDIPMVYISSVGVFDGTKEVPYDENDIPNPINVYGRTKWAGETIVDAVLRNHFIIRAGWMIGGAEREKKFVSLIIQQLRDNKQRIQVVTDKYGTPTNARDFSQGISSLIETNHYGVYHLSSGGNVSRFQVAKKILEILGRADVELVGITSSSDYIKNNFPAPRPRSEAMTSVRTAVLGLNCMQRWDIALEKYLRENYIDDFVD